MDMILHIATVILAITSIICAYFIFAIECMKTKLHINIRVTWANLGLSCVIISLGTLIMSCNELITKNHSGTPGYIFGYIVKTYGSRLNRFAFLAVAVERILATIYFRKYIGDSFQYIGWILAFISNVLGALWFASTEFKFMPETFKNNMHLVILVPTLIIFIFVIILNHKFRKKYINSKLRDKYQIMENKETSLKFLPLILITLIVQLLGSLITRVIVQYVYHYTISSFDMETLYYSMINTQLPVSLLFSTLIYNKNVHHIYKKCFTKVSKKNTIISIQDIRNRERDIYFKSYNKAWS